MSPVFGDTLKVGDGTGLTKNFEGPIRLLKNPTSRMPSKLMADYCGTIRHYPSPAKLLQPVIDAEFPRGQRSVRRQWFLRRSVSEICLQHFKIHSRTSKGLMSLI